MACERCYGHWAAVALEFRILGPLEVWNAGVPLPLRGQRARALLALLLIHRGEVVSTERLLDALWGENQPGTGATALHGLVSQLRKALAVGEKAESGSILVTRHHGYVLEVEPDQVDAERFERLAAAGREALAAGNPERAGSLLGQAIALWRGPALADLEYEPFAAPEIRRLDELRLHAIESRIEADLSAGRHAEALPEIERLVREEPLRERPRAQLMLALYRAGRQGDALEEYRDARRALRDELGVEPGAELKQLEQAILRQDPALAGHPPRAGASGRRAARREWSRRTASAAILAIAAVAAAAVVATVLLLRSSSPGPTVQPNSVAVIDPGSNRVQADIPVGASPSPVAVGDGAVWVGNLDDQTVSRIDPQTLRAAKTIATSDRPTGLAAGRSGVWVVIGGGNPDGPGRALLRRIDPRFNALVSTLVLRTVPAGADDRSDIALEPRGLWVVPGGSGLVQHVSVQRQSVGARVDVGNHPVAIAVGFGAAWAVDTLGRAVTRIDPSGIVEATIPAGEGPGSVAVGEGAVWVADTLGNALLRISPATNTVVATIPVGASPADVAVGARSVWVTNRRDGTVSRVDPRTNRVDETLRVGGSPTGIALGLGRVWVTVQEAVPVAARATGQTLRVTTEQASASLDPALAYDTLAWQVVSATCAGLVGYPDRSGRVGAILVPDAAETLPSVSPDGRTYTFRIRPGVRFSPPSRELVTAATFKEAIERSLSPRLHGGPGTFFMDDVVGATAYVAGRAPHVAGLRADGNRLTIRLIRRAPDFLARLALPMYCAVPRGTPPDPKGLILPSAGPSVASYLPGQAIVLVRNPLYRGPRPRRFARIEIDLGVSRARSLAQVEAGKVDFALDGVPSEAAARLQRQYGTSLLEGSRRFFVDPQATIVFLALNTSRPLFSAAKARRAVNFAIDRRELARQSTLAGDSEVPTDQYLPPELPGSGGPLHPLHADPSRARALLPRDSPRHAVLYACSDTRCRRLAEVVRRNLAAIGIDVEIQQLPRGLLVRRTGRRGAAYDMVLLQWFFDYLDPSDFLNNTLDSSQIRYTANYSLFSDPQYDRRLRAAAVQSGPRRYAAYAQLERDLVGKAAPLAAFAQGTLQTLFSGRVGCHVYQPLYGIDLAAACPKDT